MRSDLSNFFVGKVLYVNKRTKLIKLQIIGRQLLYYGKECIYTTKYFLDGDVSRMPAKYLTNLDVSIPESFINIKMTDMIAPKIYSF